MDDKKIEMYITVGKVVAAKDNGNYPEGEKHAILAYAKATSHSEAEVIMAKELAKGGWVNIEFHKIGTIDPLKQKADSNLQTAIETGFSAVIYTGVEP